MDCAAPRRQRNEGKRHFPHGFCGASHRGLLARIISQSVVAGGPVVWFVPKAKHVASEVRQRAGNRLLTPTVRNRSRNQLARNQLREQAAGARDNVARDSNRIPLRIESINVKPSFVRTLLFLALSGATAFAADCDRACLRGIVTQYLNAMVAHNPAVLPLASKARFTEDTVERKLGEGLWKDATGLRGYRQDILDVRQGVAASQVIVEESGMPVMLVLRLKVAGKKISEIETQVTRSRAEGAIFNIDAIKTPRAEMNLVPRKAQLDKREDAIKIAEFYPAGLKIGSFVEVNAPFAADAYRIENGTVTAGAGCGRAGCEDIKGQKIMKHPDITTRVAAVDEDLGIVLLRMNFGNTGSYGPGNALIVWEAFKVYGGQIHAVEAFMRVMPAGAGSGWD